MEWNPEQTVTVGSIFVGLISAFILMLRMVGGRTDPKLLDFFKAQIESNAAREEAREKVQEKTDERLSASLDRNTEILDTVKSGVENSFNAFAESIRMMINMATDEHEIQLTEIVALPAKIIPAIDTLTQQLISHEVKVDAMTETNGNQEAAIQQILATVLRLESRVETIGDNFDTFQAESQKLGDEIKEAKQEITALKGDVSKLKPIEIEKKEETNVQSIEQPARLDSIGSDNRSSDGDHSGDSSKTVSPRAAGTDTEQRDDQSQPAI